MIFAEIFNAEAFNDSIAKIIPIIESIEENSAPAPFTYINIVIAVIAAIFGFFGTFYGRKAYIYSQKTAENVSRRSPETQKMLLEEFIIDLQKNFVRIVELEFLRSNKKDITENHLALMRLHDAETIFTPEIYNQEYKKYKKVRDLLCQVKTYSEVISVAQSHISNNKIIEDHDITDIASRNINVLKLCVSTIPVVVNSDYDYISKIIKTHVEFLGTYSPKKYLQSDDADEEIAKIKKCLESDLLEKAKNRLLELFNDCYDTYYTEESITSPLTETVLSSLEEGELKKRLRQKQWTKNEACELLLDLICYSVYIDYQCSIDKNL